MPDCLPPPYLIGAPARYTSWRPGQADAVNELAYNLKRFNIRGAPTGFGKTLMYICYALLTGKRICILTSTKALSKQIWLDWQEMGLVEIKGLNAYECVEGGPTGRFGDVPRSGYRADQGLPMMCDEAPCQSGVFCRKSKGGCLYYDAYDVAGRANVVVTNYAYFMSINRWGEGLGHFDALVLDEAHNAVEELGNFVGTDLTPVELEASLPGSTAYPNFTKQDDQILWRQWAVKWNTVAVLKLEEYKAIIRAQDRGDGNRVKVSHTILRKARDLRRVQQKLETIATMEGDWAIEWQKDSKDRPFVKFDPLWPGEYAERYLFLDINKVILTSATVRPETGDKLGINRADADFVEYPSTFNKINRPIIFSPAGAMNKNVAHINERDWHLHMNQIVGRRPNTKGIIHTVSYKRAREIWAGSEYKSRLLMHDSGNTKEVIEEFKRTTKPLIIVSPVLDTGYDFPHDQARWQIIAKMPFPVTVERVVQLRMAKDPKYRDYVTMVKLVQMAGRIVRARDDWGETFIVDSDFGWWWNKKGKWIAPRWFIEAVRYEEILQQPMMCAVA